MRWMPAGSAKSAALRRLNAKWVGEVGRVGAQTWGWGGEEREERTFFTVGDPVEICDAPVDGPLRGGEVVSRSLDSWM
jgi:hypothetical protein